MDKRILITVIAAVIIILLAGSILYLVQYNEFRKNVTLLGQGLLLIRDGDYGAGLALCDQMSYMGAVCYESAVGMKIKNNETVTKEFCDSIPQTIKMPFYMLDRKDKQDELLKVKDECYLHVS